MAASGQVTIECKVMDLGSEAIARKRWTHGTTLTDYNKGYGVIGSTAIALSVVMGQTVANTEILGVMITCEAGNVNVQLNSSTTMSVGAYVQAGQSNFYGFQTAVDVPVYLQGDAATAAISYLAFGAST